MLIAQRESRCGVIYDATFTGIRSRSFVHSQHVNTLYHTQFERNQRGKMNLVDEQQR